MSGIEDLKKKAKMSIDEMYDNQDVGNPETRTETQKIKNTEVHTKEKKIERKEEKELYHFPSQQNGKTKDKMDCKLTFNVNGDTFKAFNEIYAKRILEGKKTDKSVLACEAIALLFEKENSKE